MMRVIVFDISGSYGHFRKPYAPMSPVTFPFPPPPTVLGMVGAILGHGKEEYHEKLGWETVRIGIALKRPTRIFRAAINLLNTKTGTDKFFRPQGENTHTQVPYEFLKMPAFRIYVGELPEKEAEQLSHMLKEKKTVYTPTLGLSQCLGDVSFVGDTKATEVANQNQTNCVVAVTDGVRVEYQPRRRYQRVRVPTIMDGARVVHRYQEVVAAEDAGPISVQGAKMFEAAGETITFL